MILCDQGLTWSTIVNASADLERLPETVREAVALEQLV